MFKYAETKRLWFYNIRSYLRKMQRNNRDPWIFKTPYYLNIQGQIMGHDYTSDDSLVVGQVINRTRKSAANVSFSSSCASGSEPGHSSSDSSFLTEPEDNLQQAGVRPTRVVFDPVPQLLPIVSRSSEISHVSPVVPHSMHSLNSLHVEPDRPCNKDVVPDMTDKEYHKAGYLKFDSRSMMILDDENLKFTYQNLPTCGHLTSGLFL